MKFKIGDKVEILNNRAGDGSFMDGDIVTIEDIDEEENLYGVISPRNYWMSYLREEDIGTIDFCP